MFTIANEPEYWSHELFEAAQRQRQTEQERDEAQEAAENYHEAWQDAAVYWLEKVAALEQERDDARLAARVYRLALKGDTAAAAIVALTEPELDGVEGPDLRTQTGDPIG